MDVKADLSMNGSSDLLTQQTDDGEFDQDVADEQQITSDSNDQLESSLDESVTTEYGMLKPQILESTRLSVTCAPGESDLEADFSKVQSDFDSQNPLNAGFVKSHMSSEMGSDSTADVKTNSMESSVFTDSQTGNNQDNNISAVANANKTQDESVLISNQSTDSEVENSLNLVEEVAHQNESSLLNESAASGDNNDSLDDEEDSGQESDGSGDSVEEIVQQEQSSLFNKSAANVDSKEVIVIEDDDEDSESNESQESVEEVVQQEKSILLNESAAVKIEPVDDKEEHHDSNPEVVHQQEISVLEEPAQAVSSNKEENTHVNIPVPEGEAQEQQVAVDSNTESTSEPESNSEISAAITEEVNEPLAQQLDFLSMTQSTSSDPEVEQLTKLPETVTHVISKNGVDVYIVGTAHFSMESQEDVAKTILMTRPRVVVVELCVSRLNILRFDEETILEEAKNLNMEKVRSTIKQYGAVQGALYLLFLSTSAHLTRQLGMAPGGEFRRAYLEARNVNGCRIHLGDRPIHVTLHRALAALSLWQKAKLVWHLLLNRGPISAEEVERCKQKDLLEEMLEEMTGEFPSLSRVFVHERDVCLAHSMQLAEGDAYAEAVRNGTYGKEPTSVVGVVGIGHVAGLVRHFEHVSESDVKKLMIIPPTSRVSRVVVATIKLSVLGLVCYGCYKIAPKIPLPSAFNWNTIRQSVLFTRGSSAVAAI